MYVHMHDSWPKELNDDIHDCIVLFWYSCAIKGHGYTMDNFIQSSMNNFVTMTSSCTNMLHVNMNNIIKAHSEN